MTMFLKILRRLDNVTINKIVILFIYHESDFENRMMKNESYLLYRNAQPLVQIS